MSRDLSGLGSGDLVHHHFSLLNLPYSVWSWRLRDTTFLLERGGKLWIPLSPAHTGTTKCISVQAVGTH